MEIIEDHYSIDLKTPINQPFQVKAKIENLVFTAF